MIKFAALVIFLMVACAETSQFQSPLPAHDIYSELKLAQYGSPYSVIAHAGGGFQSSSEYRQTNTRESILKSIEDGKQLIEMDLQVTTDGVIVASHHWKHTKEISDYAGNKDDSPLSYAEFKKLRVKQSLTPVDIFDIDEIFSSHQNLILVSDKITDYKLLTSQFNWKDRLIIECFAYYQCADAKEAGISNIAFNIDIAMSRNELLSEIDKMNGRGIRMTTFRAKTINTNPDAMSNAKYLIANGFVNLVYTSNDDEFIKKNLGVSASAFYTDGWSLHSRKCVTSRCDVY